MLFYRLIVVLVLVIAPSAADTGLVSYVNCYGTYALVTFSDHSNFANKTVNNGTYAVVGLPISDTKLASNCSQMISTKDKLKNVQFNYGSCDANIFTVITAGMTYDYAQMSLRAQDLSGNGFSQNFRIGCHYNGITNATTNGTISGGGGGNPGNSTGNATGTDTVTMGFYTKDTKKQTITASLGETLELRINLTNTSLYASIMPEKCYFSNRYDMQMEKANPILFVSDGCPNSQMITNDFKTYNKNQLYTLDWTAFQYGDAASNVVYAHCVVRLCLNTNSSHCKPPTGCTTNWTVSGTYGYQMNYFSPPIHVYAGMLFKGSSGHSGTNLATAGITITSTKPNYTTWYIVAGVLGGLLCISVLVVAVLFMTKRQRTVVKTKDTNHVQYVMPLRIPRAKMDYTTLPAYSGSTGRSESAASSKSGGKLE